MIFRNHIMTSAQFALLLASVLLVGSSVPIATAVFYLPSSDFIQETTNGMVPYFVGKDSVRFSCVFGGECNLSRQTPLPMRSVVVPCHISNRRRCRNDDTHVLSHPVMHPINPSILQDDGQHESENQNLTATIEQCPLRTGTFGLQLRKQPSVVGDSGPQF